MFAIGIMYVGNSTCDNPNTLYHCPQSHDKFLYRRTEHGATDLFVCYAALKPWTHSISSSGCYVLNLYFIWLCVELRLTLLARTSLTDALPCSTDFKARDLGAGFFPMRAYPNSIEN